MEVGAQSLQPKFLYDRLCFFIKPCDLPMETDVLSFQTRGSIPCRTFYWSKSAQALDLPTPSANFEMMYHPEPRMLELLDLRCWHMLNIEPCNVFSKYRPNAYTSTAWTPWRHAPVFAVSGHWQFSPLTRGCGVFRHTRGPLAETPQRLVVNPKTVLRGSYSFIIPRFWFSGS